jgi:dTDP-4-dehydrorhamnose reductase
MTIAITGCRGQLGAELCRQFGAEAVGLELPEFDLTDRARVLATLREIRPRAVINAAAYTLVDKAERETALCRAVNVEGVANLADACRQLDCVLVHMSTDYVFGRDRERTVPYRETDEPGPQSIYAWSKLQGEHAASTWRRHLIVRTCGLYGRLAERSAGNFVETMLRIAADKNHLRVVNDQRCTPTYTLHLVRAIRFLLNAGVSGTYHVTNAGDTTWHDFAKEIFRQSAKRVRVEPITTAQWGSLAERPAYSVLDCSKYHLLLGAPPMPPWREALAQCLKARAKG